MKAREIWRPVPNYAGLYDISDMGRVKNLADGSVLDSSERWVILRSGLDTERIFISELFDKAFPKREPSSSVRHTDILSGLFELKFTHPIQTPSTTPDFERNSMKYWCVEDGFICCSPMRSFVQGNCKFVFPYEVSGNKAYLCSFDEIKPRRFRQRRNSGVVHIATLKKAVFYREAISIVYKRLTDAVESKKWWKEGKTHLKYSYINSAISKANSGINAVVVRNGMVYILAVDYRQLHADYRELMTKDHLNDLCIYVRTEMHKDRQAEDAMTGRQKIWFDAFGFSKGEFLRLVIDLFGGSV